MYKYLLLLCTINIFFISCDELEVAPQIDISNCNANQIDKDNYALLIANEKLVNQQLDSLQYDPKSIEAIKVDSFVNTFSNYNIAHENYRNGFTCEYWGISKSFSDALFSIDGNTKDLFILEPENYKKLFKINSSNVKKAINQDDWIKEDVYVFPGISRVPWDGASPEAIKKVINKINSHYNTMRISAGLDGNVELFTTTDHLFPHATFHQVYVDVFISNLKNNSNLELHQEMEKIQVEVSKRFIMRAPKSIE